MKKLFSTILVLGLLLGGNAYAESSWFEIKHKNNTSKHWNLNKAEEIAPNVFKIPTVNIKADKKLSMKIS